MYDLNNKSPIFVYPDPIIDIEMLSGAMFLYFDRPIALTLPPLVITEKSYKLLSIIDEKKPKWGNTFYGLFNTWQLQQKYCNKTFEILNPLKREHFINTWTVYPADKFALERSKEMIESSGISLDDLKQMINPINAPGELIRHIMLEAFLECNENVDNLFDYCETLFDENSIEKLLVLGYILRLHFLKSLPISTSIAITNYPIWNKLLNDNVVNLNDEEFQGKENIDRDVISWEIFKNIISPRLDPMDKEKVEYIVKLFKNRKEQIKKLKLKCFSLSDKLKNIEKLDD